MPERTILSEQNIRELIEGGNENRNLDYKGPFSWSDARRDEKVEIVKDILAFSNARDGGAILIGIDDSTNVAVGLTNDQSASFDQTSFNDFVQKYTDPVVTCDVYRRQIDGKRIVVIAVPEFEDVPILCKLTAQSEKDPRKLLLRKGGLYKRTDKATSVLIEDSSDMRELLNRGVLRRQDELMFAMKQILQPNESLLRLDGRSPFDKEIDEANQYFRELWDGKLQNNPHWNLTIRPEIYVKHRISNLGDLRERVHVSAVSLRGWTFPFASRLGDQEWSNFHGGSQSSHDTDLHAPEAFRAYQSGLIVWCSGLWEQNEGRFQGGNVLSFISAIYSTTEWVLFAQRYFESLLSIEDSIRIEVDLKNTMNQRLISADPLVSLYDEYRAKINSIHVEETSTVSELRTDPQSIARKIVRKLFEMFNWNNPPEEILISWQEKLISRRF